GRLYDDRPGFIAEIELLCGCRAVATGICNDPCSHQHLLTRLAGCFIYPGDLRIRITVIDDLEQNERVNTAECHRISRQVECWRCCVSAEKPLHGCCAIAALIGRCPCADNPNRKAKAGICADAIDES